MPVKYPKVEMPATLESKPNTSTTKFPVALPVTILSQVSEIDGSSAKNQNQDKGKDKHGKVDWEAIESFRVASKTLDSQLVLVDLTRKTFWVAALSLLATMSGMFFIWKTLTAATNANVIAKESLEINNRAYIGVEGMRVIESEGVLTRIYLPVKNFGSTPSINSRCGIVYGHIKLTDAVNKKIIFVNGDTNLFTSDGIPSNANGAAVVAAITGSEEGCVIFVGLVCIYESVFGETYTYSAYWESLKVKGDKEAGLVNQKPPKKIEAKIQEIIAKDKANH